MAITDTHCHLDFTEFDGDRDALIERAVASGVTRMILIGIDPESWAATAGLCARSDCFWRTAGLHPNSVERQWNQDLADALRAEAAAGDLVAIGETGIDLYRSSESRGSQADAFDAQLQLAAEHDLPIVIHQRSAEREVLDVLAGHRGVQGVMHCFGGDWEFAAQCLNLGLHLGIGGVATFGSAEATRDAVRRAPLDRLLLETDAPFLAPQPVRGKRNEPAFLEYVVATVAQVRGIDAAAVEQATTDNATSLFGLAR